MLLLRELLTPDDLTGVRAACVETFDLRGKHTWPPPLVTPSEWRPAYAGLATAMAFPLAEVDDAAAAVRALIAEIDHSR